MSVKDGGKIFPPTSFSVCPFNSFVIEMKGFQSLSFFHLYFLVRAFHLPCSPPFPFSSFPFLVSVHTKCKVQTASHYEREIRNHIWEITRVLGIYNSNTDDNNSAKALIPKDGFWMAAWTKKYYLLPQSHFLNIIFNSVHQCYLWSPSIYNISP